MIPLLVHLASAALAQDCNLDTPCDCSDGAHLGVAVLDEVCPAGRGRPRGVYVLAPYEVTGDGIISADVVAQPFVDGVTLRMYWKDLEPTPGDFDFSRLDGHLALAGDNNKPIRLIVATGAYSPEWLLQPVATVEPPPTPCEVAGLARRSDLGVGLLWATVEQGPDAPGQVWFPVPWDAMYRHHLALMLIALRDHIAEAGAVRDVSWISTTGSGAHNGELIHPEDAHWECYPGPDGSALSSDRSVREALQWSWERDLELWDMIFGSQGIHYTMAPINDSLKRGPANDGEDWALKTELRTFGNDLPHGRYFGVQTNGLDDEAIWSTCTSPSPKFTRGGSKRHWRIIENQSCRKFTALQTRAPENLYDDPPTLSLDTDGDGVIDTTIPLTTSDDPCFRGRVWEGMFENVKALSVDALEVYQEDVNSDPDPDLQCTQVRDVLEAAHAWLTTQAP